MARHDSAQIDLFAATPDRHAEDDVLVDAAFMARIRAELGVSLDMVRTAQSFPWKDFTQSALAEMCFDSVANWLPDQEAADLRQAYAVELDRLYALT